MCHDSHSHHRKGWSEQTINEHSFTSFSFPMILQIDFLQKISFYYNYKKPGAGVHLTDSSTGLRDVTEDQHTNPLQQRESGVLVAPAPGTTKKTKTMVSYSALIALVWITVLMIFC